MWLVFVHWSSDDWLVHHVGPACWNMLLCSCVAGKLLSMLHMTWPWCMCR